MLENTRSYLLKSSEYTNYPDDIINSLFEAEKRNVVIRCSSDQPEIRKYLITVMQQFSLKQGFNLATLHLGVYVLDVYMDQYIISPNVEHQKFAALVCLLLAAKSEDIDGAIPSIKYLLRIIDLRNELHHDDFRSSSIRNSIERRSLLRAYRKFSEMYAQLEYTMFTALDFNVIRPTCVNFINFLQPVIVSELDYTNTNTHFGSFTNMKLEARDYIYQLLEIVILDVLFFNVRPSKMAAAIIATIRTLLKIQHVWNEEMEINTRYKFIEIKSMVTYLLEKIGKTTTATLPNETPRMEDDESGFISASEMTDPEDLEDYLTQTRKSQHSMQVKKKPRLNT